MKRLLERGHSACNRLKSLGKAARTMATLRLAYFRLSSALETRCTQKGDSPMNSVYSSTFGVANSLPFDCGPLGEYERWYVVRTHAQSELRAARHLGNQAFRVFVPRCWKNRRHARRTETVSAPLFPRYIFTVVDRTRDRWRSINGTFGVDRLLMSGGEPQPVPPGLVEGLIRATDAEGNVHFDFALRQGQNVKVIAGPFANLIGSLEKLDERGRVRVLLELLGATIPVGLPVHLVAPS
jgi:transcription elongation factor/antiterminator RfaH